MKRTQFICDRCGATDTTGLDGLPSGWGCWVRPTAKEPSKDKAWHLCPACDAHILRFLAEKETT